jgi:hypothetical protein
MIASPTQDAIRVFRDDVPRGNEVMEVTSKMI